MDADAASGLRSLHVTSLPSPSRLSSGDGIPSKTGSCEGTRERGLQEQSRGPCTVQDEFVILIRIQRRLSQDVAFVANPPALILIPSLFPLLQESDRSSILSSSFPTLNTATTIRSHSCRTAPYARQLSSAADAAAAVAADRVSQASAKRGPQQEQLY